MKILSIHINTLLIAISTTLLCVNIHAQTTSKFSTGTTFTQHTFKTSPNDPNGPDNVDRGKALILNSTKIINQHVMGFGAGNPEPSPGNYEFTTIKGRIGNNTGLGNQAETVVLTACCAPTWMRDTRYITPGPTDWTPQKWFETAPHPDYFDDYADLVAEIVSDPELSNIEYVQVWNEMKGFWHPDTLEDRWDYDAYIDLYNQVWNAVDAVDDDIKVGGPYVVVNVYGDRQDAQAKCNNREMELVGDESWGYFDCRDLEVIEEWLERKNGADFIIVDGKVTNKDGVYDPDVDEFKRTERFRAFMEWLRGLDNDDAQTLPVWWGEWYAETDEYVAMKRERQEQGLPIFPLPLDEEDQIKQNALMATALARIIKSGASTALLWGPQGDLNGNMFPLGLFKDTRVPGGGEATPFYTTQKHLYDHFSEGTTLINATTDNPNIEVLASNDKTLLINMTNSDQTPTFLGLAFPLEAYDVKLIDTPQIGGGDGCNLLTNGDFSDGTADWSNWSCEVDANSGACRITNIQQVQNPWNAALVQGDFVLENGKQYEVSFNAASIQNNRTIRVKVGLSESPWTDYMNNYEEITLTPNNQPFTIPFTMSQPTTNKARLEFHIGGSTRGLVLDNIRVKVADAYCPSECDLIQNGNFKEGIADWFDWSCDFNVVEGECQITNIQQGANPWNAALAQGNFTLENGKDYEIRFDARSIQNNKTIRVKAGLSEAPWTSYEYKEVSLTPVNQCFAIPFTMSQPTTSKARLEFHIGTNTTDLIVDNVHLVAVSDNCNNNDCEGVQNGDFANGRTAWTQQRCTATPTGNGANINIPSAYPNFWDVALKQRGLVYGQGKEYRVSFQARANANRIIRVKAGKGSAPYTSYHLEEIPLTTDLLHYAFTFTMDDPTDGDAFLEFFFGDSATNLFIGEISVTETDCNIELRENLFNETITDYKVFPNPTNSNLNVSLDLIDGYDTGIIRLFDLNGRTILEEEKALSNTNQFQLNIQAIPAGMYMLRVDVGGYFLTHKVVKY